jgi:hypothetical protein
MAEFKYLGVIVTNPNYIHKEVDYILGMLTNIQFRFYRLRVCETKVMIIFGPGRKKVTEGWRKLHNEELAHKHNGQSLHHIEPNTNIRIQKGQAVLKHNDHNKNFKSPFITIFVYKTYGFIQ